MMARSRILKPEFWSDEKLALVPREARLTFAGLWTCSDDYGVTKGHPAWLKAQIFPYDADLTVGISKSGWPTWSNAAIEWLPEDRQIKVIEAIPAEHQPIFWWLKHHFRRPSEAMALHKEDYDKERDVFTIRRAFSSKELVQHTKTHRQHVIPCHPDFKPIVEKMPVTFGPYFFVNPSGQTEGQALPA